MDIERPSTWQQPAPAQMSTITTIAYTAAELQAKADRKKANAAAMTKVVSAVIAGLLLCIYCVTAFAGAAMELSHAFTAFFVSAIVGVAVLAAAAVGFNELAGKVHERLEPLVLTFKEAVDGEYMCAAGVIFASPLFIAYVCVSFVHQLVRRVRAFLGIGPPLREGAEKAWVTQLAAKALASLSQWAWASILLKAYTIGLLAWLLLYGSTLTYMSLALMIAWLKSMHWLVASAIFFVIGLCMFLLPPVPGLAVYLCAGVLLTPACEAAFGFWPACTYAAFFAVAIKLVAQVLQMKLIGERLGESTHVKAAVGVNSDLIKAIRHILQQPGLSPAKVCILCAGPDWPTAVLCGILRLNVYQMLIGLLPVFVLTVPTTLAASFQLRVDRGGVWEPMASMMLLLAALVQLATGCVALYFIEQVRNDKDVTPHPDDEEVTRVEAEEAEAQRAYVEATHLSTMPLIPRLLLLSGTAVLIVSTYLLIFFNRYCFESFALTDDVLSALCVSCERAPVKPLGWAAFGMLGYAIACLYGFSVWAEGHVKSYVKARSIAALSEFTIGQPPQNGWLSMW